MSRQGVRKPAFLRLVRPYCNVVGRNKWEVDVSSPSSAGVINKRKPINELTVFIEPVRLSQGHRL